MENENDQQAPLSNASSQAGQYGAVANGSERNQSGAQSSMQPSRKQNNMNHLGVTNTIGGNYSSSIADSSANVADQSPTGSPVSYRSNTGQSNQTQQSLAQYLKESGANNNNDSTRLSSDITNVEEKTATEFAEDNEFRPVSQANSGSDLDINNEPAGYLLPEKKSFNEITNEEFAAEAVPYTPAVTRDREDNRIERNTVEEDRDNTTSKALGWFAFVLAVASLFVWPALLGPAGAVLGVVAYMQGSRALGGWSIAIGLISLIAYLILVPFYS